jgi:ribosomal silencing factor RsfS
LQLKARKLKKAPGVTGYEGSREDHWHVVDCYNLAVHVMLPDTRRAMDLEKHWAAETRPIVIEHLKDRVRAMFHVK